MTRREAETYREHLDTVISSLADDEALNVTDLFPAWVVGRVYYGPGDVNHPQSRVQYEGILYKCLLTHTSQEDWIPGVAVSLWVKVDDPSEEWPEWVRPQGAHDSYPLGAKVSHNGKHWINTGKDGNEYEPGVWGWDEVE